VLMELSDCLLLVVVVGAGDLAIASFHMPAVGAVGGSPRGAVAAEGTRVSEKL
jgi:hypothetical protein